jgi:hypothetical protein
MVLTPVVVGHSPPKADIAMLWGRRPKAFETSLIFPLAALDFRSTGE